MKCSPPAFLSMEAFAGEHQAGRRQHLSRDQSKFHLSTNLGMAHSQGHLCLPSLVTPSSSSLPFCNGTKKAHEHRHCFPSLSSPPPLIQLDSFHHLFPHINHGSRVTWGNHRAPTSGGQWGLTFHCAAEQEESTEVPLKIAGGQLSFPCWI